MIPKFKTDMAVMSHGVADWCDPDRDYGQTYAKVMDCLNRHISGDWGDVCEADKLENDLALMEGSRLLSAYTVEGTKIWIITEADRSVTTILFPEEY